METLVLDGRRYVKASKAASNLGYTSDYVGQLCRSGQVKAHLVGRTWYVDEEELGTHRVEKKRMSRVKAREHAKKILAEYRAQPRNISQKTYEKVAIRYESDDESLIPEPRKLTIESEPTIVEVHKKSKKAPPQAPAYEIENIGEKVVMSGKLNVVDLNEDDVRPDEHTVLMKARINRKVPSASTQARAKESLVSNDSLVSPDLQEENIEGSVGTHSEMPTHRMTFAERLAENNVNEELETEDAAEEQIEIEGSVPYVSFLPQSVRGVETKGESGYISPIFGLLIPILISLGSIVLEQTLTYEDLEEPGANYEKAYTVDIMGVISEIRYKI